MYLKELDKVIVKQVQAYPCTATEITNVIEKNYNVEKFLIYKRVLRRLHYFKEIGIMEAEKQLSEKNTTKIIFKIKK